MSDVKIDIYNSIGQKAASLVSKEQPAGYYKVQFDASGFASGIYFYRIQAGDFSRIRKMVLLR